MARERSGNDTPTQATSSLVATGMRIEGDVHTDGTVRIEGVVNGKIVAGKAVVVTAGGTVDGAIDTQDAVISGLVRGKIVAASRLEVKADARIEGTVDARRMQFDYGATYAGQMEIGRAEELAMSEPAIKDGSPAVPAGRAELRLDPPDTAKPNGKAAAGTEKKKTARRVAKRKA